MRSSSPTGRHRGRGALAAVGAVALLGAWLPSAAATTPRSGAPAPVRGGVTGVPGSLTLAGLSSPGSSPASPIGSARSLPVLRPGRGATAAAARSAPVVAVLPLDKRRAPLLADFAGITARQNKKAAGFDLEPPDEGLGAGNGFVVNLVNVTGAIYRPNGRRLGSPFYLNRLFKEPAAAFTSDPRVFYDTSSRSWFATILEARFDKDGNFTESHVDLAVSTSGDPRGKWRVYRIPASNPGHTGCPCLADYPILGLDRYNAYVSTNEFGKKGFNGSQLYAVSKSQLVAGRKQVNVVRFQNLAVAGDPAYHVQPANTYGSAAAEYLMSSLDPNGTSDHRLAVWAVTRRESVTTGKGSPVLSVRVIGSERYSSPPPAHTPPGFCSGDHCGKNGLPTTGLVATDFDAMQEVQYINGNLVGALNTGVTITGETKQRSGVAWFVVHPAVSKGQVASSTHVARQGYVATRGQYLLYPHVNMTPDGAMAMVFGIGGPGTYLSAAFATARPGAGFRAIRVAAAGTGPDNGFTGTKKYGSVGRWGDYSNGQIVPGTDRVWLATQYIPNKGDGNANWGNRIFELNAR